MIATCLRPMAGANQGVNIMKRIVTFAAVAGGALLLAACDKAEEAAPAAEPTAEVMAPVEETPAVDAAEAAADDLDPTNNPIPPSAGAETAAE